MSSTDHRKQSLYFPEDMLEEIQREATRQDRSLSWIVQQAWKVARGDIRKMPSVNDVLSPVTPKPVTPAPVPVAAVAPAAPAVDGEPKP
ncbi:TIGR04563 family protein [Stigmatella erecta]|uniref:MXAN_4361/MXAN_4362 family small protein n=1 Tax=Stigmatella erecta TaxID=83460 RepID=A0A1H9YVY2_9BACT|nr:TIGR04563 family protein [Stigmatella erecta]SES72720.1 MXAN_4361/MXAN_4362 family small protein [Stigmatella erecta]